MKTVTSKEKKNQKSAEKKEKHNILSYRMKCTESGNGLSHYIMYGDVPEEN